METSLDQNFWNQRWKNQQTGWDIGYASTPIVTFMEKYPNKDARILIPGCGNAYEAAYLLENGFTNLTLIDIAPIAIQNVKEKFKNNPHINIVHGDFFEHKGEYDLLIEQTFFCALEPKLRSEYVKQASSLLADGGEIMGLLFGKEFESQGPPFGGSITEYRLLFDKLFVIEKMELCYNSIAPREGSELFIKLRRNNRND
ncbi:TPMT family class I SAM-dependent methyltransferase [Sphingobacterium daejeonense]|uniref:TPMT family class I SAM-dependent methyltransferase n=1 Tax=Sphingobacterium daejeonense TaxID=371142 RepID=UPI0021A4DC5F|nr:TPMT family class I SAM-dependent methyltransferase [Sphingobacterium daejeonense]MCT1529736.1 TPMT family class I SAM-dependent methyltransferase [Sphingobacterium daejeonense]